MKKMLLILPLLFLVSCGGDDKIYTPDYKDIIDDNTDRITELENRVDTLETNVSQLNSDLNNLSSVVTLQGADLVSLEARLDTEIDERKASDRNLRRKIRRANQKRKALARRFKRFKNRQKRINNRLANGLQSLEDYTYTNIGELNNAISSLRASDNLQYFLMTAGFFYLDGKINGVEQSLANRIDNLDISDIDGLNDALDTLQSNIDSLAIDDIAGLQTALNSLSGDISLLNVSVGSLNISDVSLLQAELDGLQLQIDALSGSSSSGDCEIDLRDIHNYGSFGYRADIYVDCGSYGDYRLRNNVWL